MADDHFLNGAAGGHNGADLRYSGTGCALSPRELTRYILVEVINGQLSAHGYRPLTHSIDPGAVQRNPPITRLAETAKELVMQFEARYMERNMQDLSTYQIHPERFQDAYHAIIDGIFVKGINWGRVIALISLASMMSITAMRHGHEAEVPNILEWTCTYMVEQLWAWMLGHGGWDGILEMTRQDADSWENFKNVALCTIGAIGILGFGVLLGKR